MFVTTILYDQVMKVGVYYLVTGNKGIAAALCCIV